MMPPCDHTGVPIHFHSSTTSGSAFLMSLRILLRVSPRQSPSSAILVEMSSDADWPWLASDVFMLSSWKRPHIVLWRSNDAALLPRGQVKAPSSRQSREGLPWRRRHGAHDGSHHEDQMRLELVRNLALGVRLDVDEPLTSVQRVPARGSADHGLWGRHLP